METLTKTVINPDTDQYYREEMPRPEDVRQAILEMDFPQNGIEIKEAAHILAETFSLSDEQTRARNSSNINYFRHNVVSPQFRYLLEAGKLKQPRGVRTPYFLVGSSSDSSEAELREDSREYEGTPAVEMVERTAGNPGTGEEYQIQVPATRLVKEALLSYEYPASGIQIKDIAEALADQFGLTDEQRDACGRYGLVWRLHVNIAANSLVYSGQLLKIKRGWIINPDQPDVETSDSDAESPFSDEGTLAPEVVIEQNYRDHLDRLKEDLLQEIMKNEPEFFEELVLDLLFNMGYCESRADAEKVGRSGDGGIDGIIKEDKLGLDLIYVQAKRQKEKVEEGKVRDFTGALDKEGAQKGIFITTSDFTQPAKNFVTELTAKRIILIDGEQLVQRMIDHDIGLSALGDPYQLKEVNMAYFTIDDAGEND